MVLPGLRFGSSWSRTELEADLTMLNLWGLFNPFFRSISVKFVFSNYWIFRSFCAGGNVLFPLANWDESVAIYRKCPFFIPICGHGFTKFTNIFSGGIHQRPLDHVMCAKKSDFRWQTFVLEGSLLTFFLHSDFHPAFFLVATLPFELLRFGDFRDGYSPKNQKNERHLWLL